MLTFVLNPLFWWVVTGLAIIALGIVWWTDPERKEQLTTEPSVPHEAQLPETETWVSKLDAVTLVSQSRRIAAVRLDWARKYDIKNAFQEAMVLMENQNAEKDRDLVVGGAIDDCFREVESEYPGIRKDGKYSKEILEWWLGK